MEYEKLQSSMNVQKYLGKGTRTNIITTNVWYMIWYHTFAFVCRERVYLLVDCPLTDWLIAFSDTLLSGNTWAALCRILLSWTGEIR